MNLRASLNRKPFYLKFLNHLMTETFSLNLEMPEFMKLVDAEARQQILEEVAEKIRDEVSELFERTAKEIVVEKMNLLPGELPEKRAEEPDISGTIEVTTALAEEVISMPAEDALQKLRLSLAQGEIDEDTYEELKALVEPVKVAKEGRGAVVCPQCGKEMESTVNFCRFCGAKLK